VLGDVGLEAGCVDDEVRPELDGRGAVSVGRRRVTMLSTAPGAVQFKALGSGQNDAVRYALGAMLGLAAVGVVLLVFSVLAQRRTGQPQTGTERHDVAKADIT